MADSLASRPGFIERRGSALSRDLGRLGRKHRFIGAVLIEFHGERVGTASWAANDEFLGHMTELADKVLVQIDDGKLDPGAASAERSRQRLITAAIALARSDSCIEAILLGQPDAERLYEPWPEMDGLIAALDEAQPGWREALRR